jgi:hypothetical protein
VSRNKILWRSVQNRTKKGRFSLGNRVRGEGHQEEVGHMGFDDRSYGRKLTRATAQRGGHTVNNFNRNIQSRQLQIPVTE